METNPAGRSRLVVVSNRLPLTLKRTGDGWRTERSAGGLATAMGPLLKQSGGIWVGWTGDTSDPSDARRRRLVERWASQDGYFAVDLPAGVARGYYEGFSNQALWPLFHHFPILVSFDPEDWRAYREANERFRDEVVKRLRPGDLVWVHDYQLMLLPRLLREAVPPPDLLPLLEQLAADPANAVVLVSGRPRQDLERWFGEARGLWLAAEAGATVRRPGAGAWEPFRADHDAAWKESVRPVFEHYVDRTPGSLVEEKEFALVWHYRMADPEFGEWLANELVSTLEQLLAETELRAFRGQKIVEVKPSWANKGEVLARLTRHGSEPDFCLAAGDDRTDEDLFARLPEDAWTIHVGDDNSRARFCLPGPEDLRDLLRRLAGPAETRTAAAGEQRP